MLHITYASVYCCRLSFTVVVVSVFETENKCRALSACTETNSNTLTHIPQKPKSPCMRHFSKRLSFDLMTIGLREIEYSTAIWFPIKFDECPFSAYCLYSRFLANSLFISQYLTRLIYMRYNRFPAFDTLMYCRCMRPNAAKSPANQYASAVLCAHNGDQSAPLINKLVCRT